MIIEYLYSEGKTCKAVRAGRKNRSNMIRNVIDRFHKVVYHLWYPALLGSMIFEMYPKNLEFSTLWFFRLGIVLFYLLDYFHLITFMQEEYDIKHLKTWKYAILPFLDFCISTSLWLAFKPENNYQFSFVCLIIVLICISLYSVLLKTEIKLLKGKIKIPLWLLYFFFALVATFLCCYFWDNSEHKAKCFISIMVVTYFFLMLGEEIFNKEDDKEKIKEKTSR